MSFGTGFSTDASSCSELEGAVPILFLIVSTESKKEMPPQPLTSMYLGAVMMLMMWSVTEITGSVGVCTKSEVVTKTRLHFVHRTYLESYRTRGGGNCGYYYSSWENMYQTPNCRQLCE
ncbi:uncharacterized protein LOC124354302 isoform X1 [Homalodisca vitripennis]|uniref:uncharacterized protein LOC124354302 isoform X1 n=1 Tax=Homalodisca vitripennis TaxID=197043 RepID=UPI001EEC8D52|nr:uncharacterized protein LOC124354302 isoform X1 [Homalodisca vitripennis]